MSNRAHDHIVSQVFLRNSRWWKLSLVAILIIFVWLYLWFFPWQAKLHHIIWLQLAVGLAIFIVPGLCVYGLLSDSLNLEFNHITFGFVISHLILALLGIVVRFIHLSFEVVTFLMMALGLILLLIYLLPIIDRGIKIRMDRAQWTYVLSVLPILLVSLLVSLIVIQRVLSDDDLTYLAYVTNWQHSTGLDFSDPIFGEFLLAQSRFWLMSAPVAQAFLAEISRIPGIVLLGGYYEPFLVIFSVLCWYELAIALKLSPKAASASVVLQLTFLLLLSEYRHPGAPYFDQLSTDKATAAFILAPVFFQSLIKLLESPTRKNKWLFLMAGLSLTFMHPIILAYSVFIGGVLIFLDKNIQGFRNKWIPMTILMVILLPQIVIRFVQVPATEPISFDPEVILNQSGSDSLITQWGNTQFYGFDLNILTMKSPYEANLPLPKSILKWGWMLVPILAVIFALRERFEICSPLAWIAKSKPKNKKNASELAGFGNPAKQKGFSKHSLRQQNRSAAQFILSCFVLCFLAGFPLTGWVMGYFLNARMLARSVWLFPFGMSTVYLLVVIGNNLWNKSNTKVRKLFASAWPLITLTLFASVVFFLFLRENNLPDFEKFSLKSIRYEGLSTAGQALDQLIPDQAIVIGSQGLNDLLPGISWKSKIITFRIQSPSTMAYFTSEERETRISDTQKMFLRSTSPEDKMSLLKIYNVRFLLLQRGDLRRFNSLIASYTDWITVTEIGGMYILQIN